MKNYEAEKLKKIITQKEQDMISQVKETDRLISENLILKAQLTQEYKCGYNQALEDFRDKLIVCSKFSEFDKKLDCWSNKNELAKSLHK